MRATVAINNFNYARFLAGAIESALAQTHTDTEVIVVDDGSTDESRAVIEGFGDRIRPIFQENRGMASTHNAAHAVARGEVVLFLDSDDVLLPTAIEASVAVLEAGVSQVRWPALVVDETGLPTGESEPKAPLPAGDLRAAITSLGPYAFAMAPMSANAWARSFLDQALPMPEREFARHSDAYLSTLAPLYGEIRALPEPQTLYRVHGRNDWAAETVTEKARRVLSHYEPLAAALETHMARCALAGDPDTWRDQNEYVDWLERTAHALRELEELVPPESVFALAESDEWGAANGTLLAGRECMPFPKRNGVYWGPPAGDDEALAEVERARLEGVSLLVFPWFAFWWLEHYASLRTHLGSPMVETPNLVAYALQP
jgi:Glycosyl transferase family 2